MKAQMEIMGLAFIVILISFGMIFVVKEVVLKENIDTNKEYSSSELASNFLDALLETNAPACSDVRFTTLFQDCADHCGGVGLISCGADDSCDYLRTHVDDILQSTFAEWKIDYFFIVHRSMDDVMGTKCGDLVWGNECTGDRKVKIQPIPLESGDTVFLSMYICG